MSPRAARRLRFGFTTGACAAAAAKAACLALRGGEPPRRVSIPFPEGQRHAFAVQGCGLLAPDRAMASVIKDAGDDPDVTNGAEIVVRLEREEGGAFALRFAAGEGVGTITKPGLPLAVGEPAINPGPRAMIRAALNEALAGEITGRFAVTVGVARGRDLARKTLNERLGIMGGLSILGTTGIVRPLSAEAWTATILASMSVARAVGCDTVVLSTGRTSERAVQGRLDLPVEAYAMMGDYLHFSLTAARTQGFARLILAGMWAKLVKAALAIPQTHVRHGALETGRAAELIGALANDQALAGELARANTVREIYDRLAASGRDDLILAVCERAKRYAVEVSGLPVSVYLVIGPGQVACGV